MNPKEIQYTLLVIGMLSLGVKAQRVININPGMATHQPGLPGSPGFRIIIQKTPQLASGSVQPLASVRSINITYDYEYMAVCNFTSEVDYLEDIKKNHPKTADDRIDEWKQLSETVLEPKFEEFFNKYSKHMQGHNAEAKNQPTLIVKILREDPHYHREMDTPQPYLITECTFLDAEGYFIARFNLSSIGSHAPNVAERLGECYAIAGKMLAREITKQLNKLEPEK